MNSAANGGFLQAFRQNRLGLITRGDTPVRLADSPKTVIHMVPLSSNDSGPMPIDDTVSQRVKSFYYSHYPSLTEEQPRSPTNSILFHTSEWYVQISMAGTVEIVETGLLKPHASERLISSPNYELASVDCVKSHLIAQRTFFSVNELPVIAVMISLVGVSGFAMNMDTFRGLWTPGSNRIDDDTLTLPSIALESAAVNLFNSFRPAWDALWRSAGWEGSPHYSVDGQWNPDWSRSRDKAFVA
jgi:hypothetical protein